MITKYLPFLLCFPLAILGSFAAVRAQGKPLISYFMILLGAILGGTLWWWMCKTKPLPYVVMNALYTIIYEGGYVLFLVVWSTDVITVRQWIGVGLSVVSMILMSI